MKAKQLLIIDVQQSFKVSHEVVEPILELSKNFDNVLFLYDVIDSSNSHYDMWDEFLIELDEGNFNPDILTKEYGFFRNLMDKDYDDSFIIELGKLMVKNSIYDARQIEESKEVFKSFLKLLKKYKISKEELDFDSDTVWIPDLKDDLQTKVINGVILVGGGRKECLKEVALLLDVLDISYFIDETHCY